MIKLYQDIDEEYGSDIPFVIDMGDGLTRWCTTPKQCLESYLDIGINQGSCSPETVDAVLIGTYESIEVMKLEWLLDE